MKFDKNGKFLMAWGKKGMGPSEFDVPHTLAMDSKGRLYVGDRWLQPDMAITLASSAEFESEA